MNLLKNAPGTRPGHLLGIRPEHLDLTPGQGWAVTVETVELLGAERLVYARLNGEALIVRMDEAQPAPALGSTVHVTPRPNRVHHFDAASGRRVAGD
jgi:sn-glycerol 3-phosphate transport system ATP-binding protein